MGSKGELVENLQIPIGVGADTDPANTYKIPFLIYSFEEEGKISSILVSGEGKSIGDTRQDRQLRSGTRSTIGLSRIFVFSEAASTFGLKDFLDICINNPQINDRAICVVCTGKAEDMLKYKVKGYPNSAEYIEKMVSNLQQYNFYPMQYTLIDLLVRVDEEGRNALLPIVEIKGTNIETIGLAIFNKDKLVGKAGVEEARIINILKENNVKGILTLQKDSKKYINCFTVSKRKIKCDKINGKYKFVINLDLKGNIISNELYENLYNDPKVLKKFEEDMKIYVEKMCNESINKIKLKYKTDVLDLGRLSMEGERFLIGIR
ncbi:Ger(x)C family spore germination protein [Clostridium algoriphilum]|uniref:Ger(x)C family spore germination protein n=1 Tax=Clostridium algoriphilum TaxID=198347 RepID=UPI0021F407E5|nr:Ger(x)C family spore germination C-terminal domain-containing protein [Clostridium algoriphilum]